MKGSRTAKRPSVSKGIILMSISNHLIWSSHHVLSRYLQVQANPPINGMVILSTGKLVAMVMTYFWGDHVSSWYRVDEGDDDDKDKEMSIPTAHSNSRSSTPTSSPTKSSSYTALSTSSAKDDDENPSQVEQSILDTSNLLDATRSTVVPLSLYWSKTHILLLNAFLTTTRASLNVASSKYATSYNLSLINSSVIFLVPLADRIFLQATLPKALWYAVLCSIFGSILIALSHVPYLGDEDDVVSRTTTLPNHLLVKADELYGCFLQLISCLFIVALRLLIRLTDGLIKPTELVQSANIGTFLFPAIYITCIDPSAWKYTPFMNLTNLMVWLTLSFLIFFFAATAQVSLVQVMGPGLYSSFTAIRIVGAVALSSLLLHETIRNRLEFLGLAVNVVTMSVYLWVLYRDEWGISKGSSRKSLVEFEREEVELQNISTDSSMEIGSDDENQTDSTSSSTKREHRRLVRRK